MSAVFEGVEFLELRDRVLALEETVAELTKWTKFNQQETPVNNGVVDHFASVGISSSEPTVGEFHANVQNAQNNWNPERDFEEEMDIICKVEVMDEIDPLGTSDKIQLGASIPVIPEGAATPSSEFQDEGRMAETGSNHSTDVTIPQPIKMEDGSLHSPICTDSKSAKEPRNKRSSSGLRSPSKQLSRNSRILSTKEKNIVKRPNFKCPHCPKIFSWKNKLENHIRSHTGERPFCCPHCPHATSEAGSLRAHIRRIHPDENQNLLQCKICQDKFPNQTILTAHMKSHFKCYFCSLKFKTFYQMENHLATHTEEKPFNCPHCLHSTARESCLKDHIRCKHPVAKQP